eukprot:RCo002724
MPATGAAIIGLVESLRMLWEVEDDDGSTPAPAPAPRFSLHSAEVLAPCPVCHRGLHRAKKFRSACPNRAIDSCTQSTQVCPCGLAWIVLCVIPFVGHRSTYFKKKDRKSAVKGKR